jgi:hypothetical protein
MLNKTLDVHLRLLAVRRNRQSNDVKRARAHVLRDRSDSAAFARAVAALEYDDDPQALELDLILKMAKLHLKAARLLFVLLFLSV